MTDQYQYIKAIEASYLGERSKLVMCIILNKNQEAWKNYVQHLSEMEYQQLQNQRTSDAQNSFCFGKISAKMAVSQLIQNPLKEITINHGVFGFPIIRPYSKGYHISIAHTNNSGIAVCFDEKLLVGIDMEEIKLTNNATILISLSDKEIKLKSSVDLADTLFYHMVWSAKEALSKALRTGFLIPLLLLEVKSISNESDYYKVEFENFSLFTGLVFQIRNHLVALVIPTRLSINTDFIQEIIKQSAFV